MLRFARTSAALLMTLYTLAAVGEQQTATYAGSASCKGCHEQSYKDWSGSHHDLAMQVPSGDTVLGDFEDSTFTYAGVTTRFFRDGKRFMVRTDGPDGELTDFEVSYVFGVDPLQQYLLPLDNGRLQALSIAWDSRTEEAGGQRWFHLYPDERIDHADPLHWTGPYHNWNTRCAECHSTDLQKNYDPATRSFSTRFEEIDVGCEACHGPGERHRQLAADNALKGVVNGGFPVDLAQRGEWAFTEDHSIAARRAPPQGQAQIDNCARCHARRGTLGNYQHGRPLLDTHRLSLPREPLYYPDGQILDEVYVYGSFVQSKMHQAGVVCSNCHNPHSTQLRAEGNDICAQCHKPQTYDRPEHHHHPIGSAGASCANCHMPETTYMVVDPRRDHSMRIPRPDLSVVEGTPNACTACHTDQDDSWALDALRDWGINFRDTASHPARAFAAAGRGDNRGAPTLARIAASEDQPAIWRAAATEAMAELGTAEAMDNARAMLTKADPILRLHGVRAMAALPLPQRYSELQGLINDPVTAVRLEVAVQLAGVPLDQLPPERGEELLQAFNEYLAVQEQHADMPSIQLQLGLFHASRGDATRAEYAYREALYINPQMVPALLNLADLMRATGREADARAQLQQALKVAPDSGDALHSLGLLESRTGHAEQALEFLGRAAQLEQRGVRHRYVYAIALHDSGDMNTALKQLRKVLRDAPNSTDILLALANYSAEAGQQRQAVGYAQKLVQLDPRNQGYAQLLRQLQP